jgi:hypothetical protein
MAEKKKSEPRGCDDCYADRIGFRKPRFHCTSLRKYYCGGCFKRYGHPDVDCCVSLDGKPKKGDQVLHHKAFKERPPRNQTTVRIMCHECNDLINEDSYAGHMKKHDRQKKYLYCGYCMKDLLLNEGQYERHMSRHVEKYKGQHMTECKYCPVMVSVDGHEEHLMDHFGKRYCPYCARYVAFEAPKADEKYEKHIGRHRLDKFQNQGIELDVDRDEEIEYGQEDQQEETEAQEETREKVRGFVRVPEEDGKAK